MNRNGVRQLLSEGKFEEIHDLFSDYNIDKSSLLTDSLKLTDEQLCDLFWCIASFLASNDISQNMSDNGILKTYLAQSFFPGQSMDTMQSIKSGLPDSIKAMNDKRLVANKLWDGLSHIGRQEQEIQIAWATCFHISIP